MSAIISVQNLSKQYTTGESLRYKALRDVISDKVRACFRPSKQKSQPDNPSRSFWALNEVSFDVSRGEVLGVVGHNGAGKSTLLKVLTRITAPTSGQATIHGRVGSLLEVGTGFHPELTGRENVFLNGTILGMSRTEIHRRFDEIVDFANVSAFIDTPVKRYSSGMQMRLAFAVAAHLDPEILLVDEVLAVGDAAFRQKSLDKMNDVARQGRTVLFVSHNMAAVMNLCQRAILLDHGKLIMNGPTQAVVQEYLTHALSQDRYSLADRQDRRGTGAMQIQEISWLNSDCEPIPVAQSGADLMIRLHYAGTVSRLDNVRISLSIDSVWGQRLCTLDTTYTYDSVLSLPQTGYVDCTIPRLPLAAGAYDITLYVAVNGTVADWVRGAGRLHVEGGDFYGHGHYPDPQDGALLVHHKWHPPAYQQHSKEAS
jgi:lipopolysaccharide transport system ATP-binding protein